MRLQASLGLLLSAPACGCGEEPAWTLPDIAASSKYIDYGTWADTASLCVDDRLAAWDRFIERTSAALDVPPPATRIRYTWVPPEFDAPERWGCVGDAWGCSLSTNHLVFVREFEILHEVAHAVEWSALGSTHLILSEGMAEYLSESANESTEGIRGTFPQDFWEMLHAGNPDDHFDYSLAMHFVGSLVTRHGMPLYREFRQRLDRESTSDEFIAAYEAVFQEDLVDALEWMTASPVLGRWIPWGCDDSFKTEVVPWTAPGQLHTVLEGECGDTHFFVGGATDSVPSGAMPGMGREFRVQVDDAGLYKLTVQADAPFLVRLEHCPETQFGRISLPGGSSETGELRPGPHFLQVFFAPGTDPESPVPIDLELISPLPP